MQRELVASAAVRAVLATACSKQCNDMRSFLLRSKVNASASVQTNSHRRKLMSLPATHELLRVLSRHEHHRHSRQLVQQQTAVAQALNPVCADHAACCFDR
jgi:hypothetical protein